MHRIVLHYFSVGVTDWLLVKIGTWCHTVRIEHILEFVLVQVPVVVEHEALPPALGAELQVVRPLQLVVVCGCK